MNKLLFYADFSMHKQTGFSMSGVRYRAITMGPVPNKFNSIFEYLANNGDLEIQYTHFSDGGTGEQFIARQDRPFNKEIFIEKELQILEQVSERFKNTSTNEIIEISHKEKAWMDNHKEGKLIDYTYSFDLKFQE